MPDTFHNSLYTLGCPVWNSNDWRGTVYPQRGAKDQWLNHYSQVFNTVEGNSTFYGLPSLETIEKWGQRSADGFEFCLKFPSVITHEQQLLETRDLLPPFLACLEVLQRHQKLGPSLLQLPPYFSPNQSQTLVDFLKQLPADFPYAVEVRHLDWFQPPHAEALDELLEEHQVDRVIFDSRPLYALPASDESERASQSRKPKLPVAFTAPGSRPMLRLIGRNSVPRVADWLDPWTDQVAEWVSQGKRPIIFTHTPDDAHAPEFAQLFHNHLASKVPGLKPLSQWPHQQPVQRELF